jgi:hypothetical protein
MSIHFGAERIVPPESRERSPTVAAGGLDDEALAHVFRTLRLHPKPAAALRFPDISALPGPTDVPMGEKGRNRAAAGGGRTLWFSNR